MTAAPPARPAADVTVRIRSPKALSYLLSAPGSLGLARAYVSGETRLDGDVYRALSYLWSDALGSGELGAATGRAAQHRPEGAALGGGAARGVRRPSLERRIPALKRRDAGVVSHHYDVSNAFYEWVLGPSMTYTCACYPSADASLEEAQAYKYDLVCRKLRAPSRGCGCSTSAAAGAAWCGTPPRSTACKRWA